MLLFRDQAEHYASLISGSQLLIEWISRDCCGDWKLIGVFAHRAGVSGRITTRPVKARSRMIDMSSGRSNGRGPGDEERPYPRGTSDGGTCWSSAARSDCADASIGPPLPPAMTCTTGGRPLAAAACARYPAHRSIRYQPADQRRARMSSNPRSMRVDAVWVEAGRHVQQEFHELAATRGGCSCEVRIDAGQQIAVTNLRMTFDDPAYRIIGTLVWQPVSVLVGLLPDALVNAASRKIGL